MTLKSRSIKTSSRTPARKKTIRKAKKVLLVSSECVPFIKTGGLADACGALAKTLRRRGHDVRIVLPRYWSIDREHLQLKKRLSPMGVSMGNCQEWCEVLEGKWEDVPAYFIEHEAFFGRAGLYDDGKKEFTDNAQRFGFFSKAALQVCRDLDFVPDVVHCHDWQTGLIPAYLKYSLAEDDFFKQTASVFSIHNIGYQGVFKPDALTYLGISLEQFSPDKFEDSGAINFMKGAVFYADSINTVSPSYAEEILGEPGGCGISEFLQRRKDDVRGILNGVDYDHWNPETDRLIPQNFSSTRLKGKEVCKRKLQNEFLLEENPDIPVIGVVSRFADQKGLDLLARIIREVVSQMKVQFAILGSGEKHLEDFFGGLPAQFPEKIGAWIGYDNSKSHLIEAGSDFFVMPSRYEPCGLNQIYSLKYGTLPIVRETGGLRDTIEQYDERTGEGTGFRFREVDAWALYYTIGWAVSTYYDRPEHFKKMQRKAMKQYFPWDDSIKEYEELYQSAFERRSQWK